jgi:BirA family biotin operon repressor/biotin-[acetyl-CoA-carboxylase] ligase
MSAPSDLHTADLSAGLATRWLGKTELHVIAITGSTNADLLARAADAPHGAVLIADRQTAGRGRHERMWLDQPGKDLLLSVLLRPRVATEFLASFVLAAGVAAHRTVAPLVPDPVGLKWPNDVLARGKKICGILCQSDLSRAEPVLVVGFGLNVNSRAALRPPELHDTATSLYDLTGREHRRDEIARDLLRHLEAMYESWVRDRVAVFGLWEARHALRGQAIRVHEDRMTYEVRAIGLDEHGRLVVEIDGARRVVDSGDVFPREGSS